MAAEEERIFWLTGTNLADTGEGTGMKHSDKFYRLNQDRIKSSRR